MSIGSGSDDMREGNVWVDGANGVCVVVNGKLSRAHLMRFTFIFPMKMYIEILMYMFLCCWLWLLPHHILVFSPYTNTSAAAEASVGKLCSSQGTES